jgi:signal transduction histidine kinase
MPINNTTKKIVGYILLFPPLILLVYAVITYLIFFNYQVINNQKALEAEHSTIASIYKPSLMTKVKSLNKVANFNSKENFINFLQNVNIYDNTHIVVFDKNKTILFKSKNVPESEIELLKGIKDHLLYEDDDYIAYSSSQNKNGWKITAFLNKNIYVDKVNKLQYELNKNTKESVEKNLYLLGIIWLIALGVSFFIARKVTNKLESYRVALKNSNEQIIFQSRQAMIGELLPMIAHQWRQPINKIASVLMRMRFEIAKGNPNIETLDMQCQTIESSIELMSKTIEDFRSFYRPKDKPEPVNLAIIIRKAIFFLDELLENKKIKIKTNLSNVETTIHANEFLQVIINLIKNASDAVDVGGTISITLKEVEDNMIEIRIEDDGVGIPDDKLEKIFEPHVSTKEGSMGLGLYMSKLIIELHFHGEIKAYNTENGAGFLIRIPKK